MTAKDEIDFMNKDINVENTDTILLDIRVEPEYDNEEIVLEYDNSASSSCHSQTKMPSSCHSQAQTQESRAKTWQAFRFSQSGRSMVEMLGLLAIIGVLSIGGIAQDSIPRPHKFGPPDGVYFANAS